MRRPGFLLLVMLATCVIVSPASAGCPWAAAGSDTYSTVVTPTLLPSTAPQPKYVKVSIFNPSQTITGTVYPSHRTLSQYGFGLICTPAFPLIWEFDEDLCDNSESPPPLPVPPYQVTTLIFTVTPGVVNRINLTWTHVTVGALIEATLVYDTPGAPGNEFEGTSFKLERSLCF